MLETRLKKYVKLAIKMIEAAVIGYGYWGINVAKSIKNSLYFNLNTIFDNDPLRILEAQKIYDFKVASSYEEILQNDNIEALFIVTPPHTHYHLSKLALEHKKNIFVEKPLTTNIQEAYNLYEIAFKNSLALHCDHTFLYSPAVKWIKESFENFGDIVYINSRRINLGLFQSSVDVIWDLAIHDLSIIDYLVKLEIKKSHTFSKKYKNYPYDALANINLELENGIVITINVSWLSPIKIREMIIGGEKKTIVYDDTKKDKITLFDTGVIIKDKFDKNSLYQKMIEYKLGEQVSPKLENFMPLDKSIDEFYLMIQKQCFDFNQRDHTLRVIKALEIISKT